MSLEKPVIEYPGGTPPQDLQILDIVVGEGAEAHPGDTVEVHYVGVKFRDGEEFDASWNRGESIEFPLQGLIQGWQEGIPGMKPGGVRRLKIPPELAYGNKEKPGIPANSVLVFEIELLSAEEK